MLAIDRPMVWQPRSHGRMVAQGSLRAARESERVVPTAPDRPVERKLLPLAWRAVTLHPGAALAALAVVATVVLAKGYSIANYGNVVDDALISMQYAKRL